MNINAKIFDLIKERRMTQKEFSQRTGIPQSTISDWKGKDLNPSANKILKICEVLEVTPYELLGSEDADQGKEYIMVGKGTDEYDLVISYNALKRRQKDKLLGYLDSLKETLK